MGDETRVPIIGASSVTDDIKRQKAKEIIARFLVEHDLLIKRTAAFLTLNGLMAVAAVQQMPGPLKVVMASVMLLLSVAWLFRARNAGGFITVLSDTVYGEEYEGFLPEDAVLHKKWTAGRTSRLFTTTNVFSICIPIGLSVCWVVGIIIVYCGCR